SGILGHVAAERAGALAGWIGRVEIAAILNRVGHIEIDNTSLHDRAFVLQVNLKDTVHAGEPPHQPPLAGYGPAGGPAAGAASYERNVELVGDANDRGDLLGGAREDHEIRAMLVHATVVFVEGEVFGTVEVASPAEECGKPFPGGGGQIHKGFPYNFK